MVRNPRFFGDPLSSWLLAFAAPRSAFRQGRGGGGGGAGGGGGGGGGGDIWTLDAHRSLVRAALSALDVRESAALSALDERESARAPERRRQRVMVEVGSGLGLTVIAAAARGWRVLAAEALLSNLQLLRAALAANGWPYVHDLPLRAAYFEAGAGGRGLLEACLQNRTGKNEKNRGDYQDQGGWKDGAGGWEGGGSVCSVHVAVGGCDLGGGGKVVVAVAAGDEGGGLVVEEAARARVLASDRDVHEFARAPDGSLRLATPRPVAQALMLPLCLFLSRSLLLALDVYMLYIHACT